MIKALNCIVIKNNEVSNINARYMNKMRCVPEIMSSDILKNLIMTSAKQDTRFRFAIEKNSEILLISKVMYVFTLLTLCRQFDISRFLINNFTS